MHSYENKKLCTSHKTARRDASPYRIEQPVGRTVLGEPCTYMAYSDCLAARSTLECGGPAKSGVNLTLAPPRAGPLFLLKPQL